MFLKKTTLIMLLICLLTAAAFAQKENDFYGRNSFLFGTASTYHDGLLGFTNPANLSMIQSSESRFHWSTDGVDATSFNNWGYYQAMPHFGFGLQRQKFGDHSATNYYLGFGLGDLSSSFGLSYSWATGDAAQFDQENYMTASLLMRPFNFVSFSIQGSISTESDWNEAVAELGIRPLGTSQLTLFADAATQKGLNSRDIPWSAGAAFEFVDGVTLTGRYFDNESFTMGLNLNLGKIGFGGQTHYNKNQKHAGYTYYLRAGSLRPSALSGSQGEKSRYVAYNLKGPIRYHRYAWFDNSIRFLDLLKSLRAAAEDHQIGVVALNLSGMAIYPEMAWEIREALKKVQASGKKVVIFFDNGQMTSYHLASVADKIVIDPEGMLLLPGFAAGKTYFKGTLQKLGLAFDEWRFMKYKSAVEVLSRDSFSDADREQYQDYVDDRYDIVREDICHSRKLTFDQFDKIVDDQPILTAPNLIETGLVDTLARWSDKDKVILNLFGQKYRGISPKNLTPVAMIQTEWSEKPEIAIVYGLGECALDTGIKARWLEKVFLRLMRDFSVKAVVFRVDSPGGDGMASDLVATALKKCARVKPVIISQGQVAGSGGYWISMYGNKIVAGPNTITGSIGVIGGWLYDDGAGEKIGLTSDHVQRGKHADFGVNLRIPFINLGVPVRKLTEDERLMVKDMILDHYDLFMSKVADGRNMTIEEVREIAQGHFYSGKRGKDIGLVDEIGGLMTALTMAMNQAGFKKLDDIQLKEYPRSRGFMNLNRQVMPFSVDIEDDPTLKYIRMSLDNPTRPLMMLYPGTYPDLEK